jgi:hypothetical protein
VDTKPAIGSHALGFAPWAARQDVPEPVLRVIQPAFAGGHRDEAQAFGLVIHAAIRAHFEMVQKLLRGAERDVVQGGGDAQALGVELRDLDPIGALVLGLHDATDHENAAVVLHQVDIGVHPGKGDVVTLPEPSLHVVRRDPRLALRRAHERGAFHHGRRRGPVVEREAMAARHGLRLRPRHRRRVVAPRHGPVVVDNHDLVRSVEVVHHHSHEHGQVIHLGIRFPPPRQHPPRSRRGVADSQDNLAVGRARRALVRDKAQQPARGRRHVQVTKREAVERHVEPVLRRRAVERGAAEVVELRARLEEREGVERWLRHREHVRGALDGAVPLRREKRGGAKQLVPFLADGAHWQQVRQRDVHQDELHERLRERPPQRRVHPYFLAANLTRQRQTRDIQVYSCNPKPQQVSFNPPHSSHRQAIQSPSSPKKHKHQKQNISAPFAPSTYQASCTSGRKR